MTATGLTNVLLVTRLAALIRGPFLPPVVRVIDQIEKRILFGREVHARGAIERMMARPQWNRQMNSHITTRSPNVWTDFCCEQSDASDGHHFACVLHADSKKFVRPIAFLKELNARIVVGAGMSLNDLMIRLVEAPGENFSFGQRFAQRAFVSAETVAGEGAHMTGASVQGEEHD